MAWLEAHQTLPRHRKTLRVSRLLNIDRQKVVGMLMDLWAWGLNNADVDGDLGDVSADQISEIMGYPAKRSGKLIEALSMGDDVSPYGFIEINDKGHYILHDWADYTWRFFDKIEQGREQTRKRVADYRKRKKALQNQNECNENSVTHVTPVTVTSNECNDPTVPNLTYKEINKENVVENDGLSDLQKVSEHYENTISSLLGSQMINDIKGYLGNGMTPEDINAAIDEVKAKTTSPSWSQINRNIDQWQRNGWHLIGHDKIAYDLALDLRDALKEAGTITEDKPEPVLQAWARDFEAMLKPYEGMARGEQAGVISEAIAWTVNSDFWRKVILSADSLRKHFDKIRAQMGDVE